MDPLPNGEEGPDTYDSIQAKLNAYAAKSQQAGAARNLASIEQKQALSNLPVQVDLTPLMALTDTWTGSKLAQSYKPPTTAAERVGMMQKIQSEINKNSDQMDDNQVKLLKSQLEVQASKELAADRLTSLSFQKEASAKAAKENRDAAAAERKLKQASMDDEKQIKHIENTKKDWMNDPIVKDARQKLAEVENFGSLLADAEGGNAVAASAIPGILARIAGEKGVLTDKDITRYSGSTALGAQWKQNLERAESGNLTPENLAYFKQVADSFAKRAEEGVNKAAAFHVKTNYKNTKLTPEELLDRVTGGTVGPEYLNPPKKSGGGQHPVGYKFKDAGSGKVYEKVKDGSDEDESNYKEVD